jgi:hypothetical protein
MRRGFSVSRGLLAAPVGGIRWRSAGADGRSQPRSSARAVLNRCCITCHNQKLKTGGLMLDTLDVAHVVAQLAVRKKVVRKLCRPESVADEMPCPKSILSTLARRAHRRPPTSNRCSTTILKVRNHATCNQVATASSGRARS